MKIPDDVLLEIVKYLGPIDRINLSVAFIEYHILAKYVLELNKNMIVDILQKNKMFICTECNRICDVYEYYYVDEYRCDDDKEDVGNKCETCPRQFCKQCAEQNICRCFSDDCPHCRYCYQSYRFIIYGYEEFGFDEIKPGDYHPCYESCKFGNLAEHVLKCKNLKEVVESFDYDYEALHFRADLQF